MSGIWMRMQEIFAANSHAALDQIEDPQRMSRQILRDIDADLTALRQRMVAVLARGKTLRAERAKLERRRESAQRQAAEALRAGDESQARRQLETRLRCEREYAALAEPLQEAEQALEVLRAERDALLREREDLASQARLIQYRGATDTGLSDLYSRSLRRRERMAEFAQSWQTGSRSLAAARELREEELGHERDDDSGAIEDALARLRADLAGDEK